jgi:hypothetical protein
LTTMTSFVAGVVRVGVQFVEVVHAPPETPLHVYVVCENPLAAINNIQQVTPRKNDVSEMRFIVILLETK